MYVIIDSNIWISELGLSTAKGLALQFHIKQKGAVIAIPEVVRREVETNIGIALSDYCENIKKCHRQLLSIFGKLKEIVLPDENAINKCVEDIFSKVSAEKLDIPFSIESANQSLYKVIKGLPPSGPKNQQFKDGVIWADCLALLEHGDVTLVTEDKAFYQDRNLDKGLVASLKLETKERKHQFKLYSSITDLLEEIQTPVEIDEKSLVEGFFEKSQESINKILEKNGFETSGDPEVNISSYITEKVDNLFIEFAIIFNCDDTTGANRTPAVLTLKGEGTFNISDKTFTGFRNQGECLDYVDSDGKQQSKSGVFLMGNIVIGHRDVEHIVRHKISN